MIPHKNTSLLEETLFGVTDWVEEAITLLRKHEPSEGYYVAFSGGKDSCVIKDLCIRAGVKFDSHYNMTTVDPPELVRFIRKYHPDVVFHRPKRSMFQLIVYKGWPPTRLMRYCCERLKEGGGRKRWKVLGIRAEESAKRAERQIVQMYDKVINPILHWKEYHVWDYIDAYKLPYCSLYDEERGRLGCIMCPMQNQAGRIRDAERYPKYYRAYMSAFDKMLARRKAQGKTTTMSTAQEVMDWWLKE